MLTAQTFMHAYWVQSPHAWRQSECTPKRNACNDRVFMASGAVLLASKCEEDSRSVDAVLRAAYTSTFGRGTLADRQQRAHELVDRSSHSLPFLRERVLESEQQLLLQLGVALNVHHPHDLVDSAFPRLLASSSSADLAHNTCSYALELCTLCTFCTACIQFDPSTLAAATLTVSSRIVLNECHDSSGWLDWLHGSFGFSNIDSEELRAAVGKICDLLISNGHCRMPESDRIGPGCITEDDAKSLQRELLPSNLHSDIKHKYTNNGNQAHIAQPDPNSFHGVAGLDIERMQSLQPDPPEPGEVPNQPNPGPVVEETLGNGSGPLEVPRPPPTREPPSPSKRHHLEKDPGSRRRTRSRDADNDGRESSRKRQRGEDGRRLEEERRVEEARMTADEQREDREGDDVRRREDGRREERRFDSRRMDTHNDRRHRHREKRSRSPERAHRRDRSRGRERSRK